MGAQHKPRPAIVGHVNDLHAFNFATMAQMVEQRIRNAWVKGSSPFGGSTEETFLSTMTREVSSSFYRHNWANTSKPRNSGVLFRVSIKDSRFSSFLGTSQVPYTVSQLRYAS